MSSWSGKFFGSMLSPCQNLYHPDAHIFCCLSKGSTHKSKNLVQVTRPFCKDDLCPFCVMVYFSVDHSRWFIKCSPAGTRMHKNHPPVPGNIIRLPTSQIEPVILALIRDQIIINTSLESINTLLRQHANLQLSSKQLKGMRRKIMKQAIGMDYEQQSPAQRMLRVICPHHS